MEHAVLGGGRGGQHGKELAQGLANGGALAGSTTVSEQLFLLI